MARPRKPDGERLICVSTNVSPARYAQLRRIAASRDVKLAALLRDLIDRPFRILKSDPPRPSC